MSGHPRTTVALAIALALPAVARVVAQDPAIVITLDTVKVQDVEKVVTEVKAAPAKKKGEDILKDAVKKIEKAVAKQPQPARPAMKMAVQFAAPVQAVKNADGLDPMAQQFVGQFTPLMKTEVHLLLSVCEPTDVQRKQIVASRGKAVKAAAKLYSQSQQRTGRFQNTATFPQPRGLVQESLLAIAKPLLSEEQIGRYQVEVDRRADDQKRLGIRNIIAKMDQDLALSADQRDRLDASLAKNWNTAWCQSLEMFMNGDQFFPAIPDGVVVPVLSPKQAAVWRGTQRNNNQFFGGFGFMNGMEMNDDFPADENVEEPKADVQPAPAFPIIIRRLAPARAEPADPVPAVGPVDAPKDAPAAKVAKPAPAPTPAEPPKDAPKDAPKAPPKPAPNDAPKATPKA